MNQDRVKRKLSAILSADVVGYSRLMGEDEVSTVRTLEVYRKVMSDLIEQFRGRVVDSPGDNLLSEFGSVVDAVQCAVEIHDVIRAKNEELPEDRRMLFRIGVNLGDVIEEGDRIYGDGVNIAARLEGLAEAGGICISGSAHEQIKNKLALGYEYIGEHTVKNISEPLKVFRVPVGPKATTPIVKEEKVSSKTWRKAALAVAAIIILGAVVIWYFSFCQLPEISDVEEAQKTIAVLPFDDLSPEKDQEYFVLGLSEEILNSLTQIPDLTVTARTSSFYFKDKDKTFQEIANALDVEYILEGSVRKALDNIRITTQLIKAVDESHIWSETYDKELKVEEMFSVQEDIAKTVADELKVTLGIGKSLKQIGGTDNTKAYEFFLVSQGLTPQGRSSDVTDLQLELFDKAISLDRDFALAWAYKSKAHRQRMTFMPTSEADSEYDAALSAVNKAIDIEPNLAQAHGLLGSLNMVRGEFIEAELAYRKGMGLTTEPLDGQGFKLIAVGNFTKANDFCEEAWNNDPLSEWWPAFSIWLSGILDDLQQAEEKYELAKEMFGENWYWGNWFITEVRLGSGQVVSSEDILLSSTIYDEVKKYIDSPNDGLAELHRFYADENNLSNWDFVTIALWAAHFGDLELAMAAIEKGAKTESVSHLLRLWLPVFKEVRQTIRFKEFVREIGLVDYWKEFGWPDSGICRPVGDDDFVCD